MSDIPVTSPPSIPESYQTCRIDEVCKIIEITTHYRGKTNSYTVDRTFILAILDSSGQPVAPVWSEGWTDIAPWIATRRENRGKRWQIGNQTSESNINGSLCIHRQACPVYVKFSKVYEYVDYDGDFSSNDSCEYWVRYEA